MSYPANIDLNGYSMKAPPAPIKSAYGVEPSPSNGNSESGMPYEYTFRFLPPSTRKVLIHTMQSLAAEYWFTFFFVFFVSASIALGADIQTKAFVKGLSYAGLSYIFWNWGRPQGNPAVTISLALVGHLNAWTTLANLVGQTAGAFTAVGIQWGFFNVDGSALPPVVTSTITLGILWGWEIFISAIIIMMIQMGMSDRMFGELLDVEMNRGEKKTDNRYAGEFAGTSRDIPIGLQKHIYSHMNAKTSAGGGVAYFIGDILGYLYLGAPIYNLWFWLSHSITPLPAVIPTGTMTTGYQFALYGFGSIIGGVGVAILICGLIWWSRKTYQWYNRAGAEVCEKEDIHLWYPSKY